MASRLSRSAYRQGASLIFELAAQSFFGDPPDTDAKFADINPLNRIDRVKILIFVAHGDADAAANVNRSKTMVAEQKKRGISFETLFKSVEGQGIQRHEDRVEHYSAIETSLAKNMKKL